MEGELDPFDFALAEKLGLMVHQMREQMPNIEYWQWRAYYTYKAAMIDLEARKAEVKRGK